jgi:hypothetical protein
MHWLATFTWAVLGYIAVVAWLTTTGAPSLALALMAPIVVSVFIAAVLALSVLSERLLRYLWRGRGTDRP